MTASPPRTRRAPFHLPRIAGAFLALVGLLLATAIPAGAATWSDAADVPDGPIGEAPAVAARSGATSATAPDGTTWVAWVQTASYVSGPDDSVRVARRAADGGWTAPVDVVTAPRQAGHTGTKLYWPALEIGPDGRPVVLWAQAKPGAASSDNVFDAYASSLGASGTWSAPHALGDATYGAGSSFNGSFAVHRLPSGAVAAAWRSSATGVRAAILGANGSWSTATELTSTALGSQREVDVAGDASDRVTVIWSDANGVSTRTRSEASWGPAQVVDPATAGSAPHIAADADGFLVATWAPAVDSVRTAHRTAGQSSWTVASQSARGDANQLAPDVAFDGHGRALLAWGETGFESDDVTANGGRIRVRTLDPDREWGAVETAVTLAGGNRPSAPRVLASAHGDTTLVWTDVRFQSPRFARLSAATRPAGESAWGPLTELTSSANGFLRVPDNLRADALGNVSLALTPLISAAQANATPVQVRDLRVTPATSTTWSSRWLPGTLNLRTFVNYLASDPDGGIFPSAGADRPEPLDRYGLRLTTTDAWRDGVTGETVLEHRGTVQLAMPSHFIDIRIVDPTIRVAADGRSARLIASGQGSGEMNPGATQATVEPFTATHLLNLDLAGTGPRPSADGRTRTWIASRARIAPGLAGRYLSYSEGSTYGDVTFSVPVDLETRVPDPVDPPVEPPVDPPGPGEPPVLPVPPPFVPGTPPGDVPAPTPTTPSAPRTTTATGRITGSKAARRRVTITVSTRLGTTSRTSYRVKLTKGGKTIATGTLRSRTLRLTVRNTARKGAKARYPRLRGRYRIAANASGKKAAKLAATTLVVR